MEFLTSETEDIDEIFRLYALAIEFQKTKFDKAWLPFDRKFIEREIAEKRHWKILVDERIACIFSIAYEDPLIWKEKGRDPAIYIHRIVTNPDFRGQRFVPKITDWACGYAKSIGKKFVRMDTWGDNQKLIDYYTECGFEFLGVVTPTITAELPKHYEGITLSLFEIQLDQMKQENIKSEMLRHTVATVAYRGGKAIAHAPEGFAQFRASETTRTPLEILRHIGDLFDWALTMAEGATRWRDAPELAWNAESERFFAALKTFDDYLAAGETLACAEEKLFQGPIADALTHIGQINLLRRMFDAPIRGENYFKAEIEIGRVGENQSANRTEFD
jgi:hypothetical protein